MHKNNSRCGEEARVRHVVITEIRPFRRSNVQGVLLCLAFTNLMLALTRTALSRETLRINSFDGAIGWTWLIPVLYW
jgi:hypothetical protein